MAPPASPCSADLCGTWDLGPGPEWYRELDAEYGPQGKSGASPGRAQVGAVPDPPAPPVSPAKDGRCRSCGYLLTWCPCRGARRPAA
jgi:hypothetical protein